jgi:hypothetical protein
MSTTAPLEFVLFSEKNHKENELFIFYLQWTGNEDELTKLNNLVSKAEYQDGDWSEYYMDLTVKLPESHVDLHCKLSDMNSYHRLFKKVIGKFTYPFPASFIPILDEYDEYETQECLVDELYSCKIPNWFVYHHGLNPRH